MNGIKTTEWCYQNNISFEPFGLDTNVQNGVAERFRQLIIEKAREMRLSANIEHKFWRKIVSLATYLYNWTPQASIDWKSPYEAFHCYVFDNEEVSVPQKPLLHQLKAFRYKAYVLIKLKEDFKYHQKCRKLDAKAHIGFLVSYKLTNIYRI